MTLIHESSFLEKPWLLRTLLCRQKWERIEKQGWKVFDLSDFQHLHASMLLKKLPDRKYGSIEEVIRALK